MCVCVCVWRYWDCGISRKFTETAYPGIQWKIKIMGCLEANLCGSQIPSIGFGCFAVRKWSRWARLSVHSLGEAQNTGSVFFRWGKLWFSCVSFDAGWHPHWVSAHDDFAVSVLFRSVTQHLADRRPSTRCTWNHIKSYWASCDIKPGDIELPSTNKVADRLGIRTSDHFVVDRFWIIRSLASSLKPAPWLAGKNRVPVAVIED